MRRFKRLERLWVCFVGDEVKEATGYSGGWLGAVGGRFEEEATGRYLMEVREQIRGDVAMESYQGRALDGWERPVVRVVKDRGVVMRELGESREWGAGLGKHDCFPYCECMRKPVRIAG